MLSFCGLLDTPNKLIFLLTGVQLVTVIQLEARMSDALKADSVSVNRTWRDLNATNASLELLVCSETTHMAAVEVFNSIYIHPLI